MHGGYYHINVPQQTRIKRAQLALYSRGEELQQGSREQTPKGVSNLETDDRTKATYR